MILHSLHPDGRRLVVPELASGERARWGAEAHAGLLRETARIVELDALDAAVDGALRDTEPHDAGLDARLAPALHRALPLTRREAADPGVFRFLTVIHRPDLVRHRWENRSWSTMRGRFWRPGTRPDSNAFSRLWWIAELTRDGESYALTERVLARQALANNLFVRDLASYRPVVDAFVDVLGDAPSSVLEAATRALSRRLSVLLLESLTPDDLRSLLGEIRAHLERDPPP
ncbi:MAG TPA: DUF6339 family protein [Sandaracinaceae bacterium LLY-WYZ-13_1]|nr:DUF6339 family protein [Sandaracinaceae bacterium LLY-WYZ-13_1]